MKCTKNRPRINIYSGTFSKSQPNQLMGMSLVTYFYLIFCRSLSTEKTPGPCPNETISCCQQLVLFSLEITRTQPPIKRKNNLFVHQFGTAMDFYPDLLSYPNITSPQYRSFLLCWPFVERKTVKPRNKTLLILFLLL